MAKEKAQYAKPASQLDLEERLENGNKSFRELSTSETYEGPKDDNPEGRDFRVEGNDVSQYVGTSPEYATYANDTEAPLGGGEGAEAQVFEEFASSPLPATLKVEGNIEYDGQVAAAEAAKEASEEAKGSSEPEVADESDSNS